MPGVVMGTPRYMAPEQIEGGARGRAQRPVRARLRALRDGGRPPPFDGKSVFAVARAITQEEPAALGGSSGVVALDRVIHRALRKRPDDRYQTAAAFAQDLRAALLAIDSASIAPVRPITRLVVMPFRILRPDPAIDFLAFSLADAVSSALSGLPSVVIRSTAAASRFATDTPDLAALAKALDVDVVLLGSMLSSGGQVRVTAQLVQAPSGTLMRAITSQSPTDEIFQLQDALAKQIVDSLCVVVDEPGAGSASIATRRPMPRRTSCTCAPISFSSMSRNGPPRSISTAARSIAIRSSRRHGRGWAGATGCSGKFGDPGPRGGQSSTRGKQAIERALEINGDLSLAHQLYAYVEVEAGNAREAMVRLLNRVRHAPSEPELFAGLVHCLPLLRPARGISGRVRTRASPRSGRGDQRRADVPADGRLGARLAVDRSEPSIARPSALYQLGRTDEALAMIRPLLSNGTFTHSFEPRSTS